MLNWDHKRDADHADSKSCCLDAIRSQVAYRRQRSQVPQLERS